MSEKPEMNEQEEWEMRVQKTSRQFEFPKTPKIAEQVQSSLHPRTLNWRPAAALILVLLLGMTILVPPIRAAVLEFLSLGAGRFIIGESPTPMPTVSVPLMQFGTQMSLEEAQAEVDYTIFVPAELGNPNTVYLQETRLPMVILVWYQADGSRLLLYIIDSDDTFFKFTPEEPSYVSVNGQRAFWFEDPHLAEFVERSGNHVSIAVEGNVLAWESDGLTYRLEGYIPQETAIRIAESLP
jgi:hypothetical protein